MNSEITPSENTVHFALKEGDREISRVDLKTAKAAAEAVSQQELTESEQKKSLHKKRL